MATIKTIKPAGGGDYTTLQAWEDWADGEASADQWAECYTGGNLGKVRISGWASTPDATHYPRIYTPLSQRHTGQSGTGAYITNNSQVTIDIWGIEYTRIEGLRLHVDGVLGINLDTYLTLGVGHYLVDSNLIEIDAVNTARSVGINAQSGVDNNVIQNNIVIMKGSGWNIAADAGIYAVVGSTNRTLELYNNTVLDLITSETSYGYHMSVGNGTMTLTAKNNIAMGSNDADFYSEIWGSGGFSYTADHNMSADATGDDWGATGSLINKDIDTQWYDKTDDWRLTQTSDAIDAGTTIGSFDWDAIHLDGDDWRPQGAAWDMGAMERAFVTVDGVAVDGIELGDEATYGAPVVAGTAIDGTKEGDEAIALLTMPVINTDGAKMSDSALKFLTKYSTSEDGVTISDESVPTRVLHNVDGMKVGDYAIPRRIGERNLSSCGWF